LKASNLYPKSTKPNAKNPQVVICKARSFLYISNLNRVDPEDWKAKHVWEKRKVSDGNL